MSSSTRKITIRGKTYNLDDVSDIVSIQAALVPENWPLKKPDGVRLFMSLQNMIAMELKRHLGANFKQALKSAIEEGEEPGGRASIAIGFSFEIDVTAPSVAALTKTAMAFSVRHGTKGKPKTHDLNQGEFIDDDMSIVFDFKSLARENKEAAKEETATPPEPGESAEPPAAPGTETAVDKPKRSHKKKPATGQA